LRQDDPIPNGEASEYVNLDEHLKGGQEPLPKAWPYKRPSRKDVRRNPNKRYQKERKKV
jgi:hypothetical protein